MSTSPAETAHVWPSSTENPARVWQCSINIEKQMHKYGQHLAQPGPKSANTRTNGGEPVAEFGPKPAKLEQLRSSLVRHALEDILLQRRCMINCMWRPQNHPHGGFLKQISFGMRKLAMFGFCGAIRILPWNLHPDVFCSRSPRVGLPQMALLDSRLAQSPSNG